MSINTPYARSFSFYFTAVFFSVIRPGFFLSKRFKKVFPMPLMRVSSLTE
jgi:hypothetical protein